MNLDDFDKRIIKHLAAGMTVKEIAEQEYNLTDEGKKAILCQAIVQAKLNLLLFNFNCKTEAQLVIKAIHELKDVNTEVKPPAHDK